MPASSSHTPNSSWTPGTITVLSLGILVVALGLMFAAGALGRSVPSALRIATGPEDGVYHPFGSGLARALSTQLPHTKVTTIPTAGSRENMAKLQRGEVDIAFVQDDTPGVANARSIAVLHEEVLQVLVRVGASPPVESIDDVRGRRVVLGQQGSGAAAVAENLLTHFGLEGTIQPVYAPPNAIEAAFTSVDQPADVAFVLSAMPSQVVDRLCRNGYAALLSIGVGDDGQTAADGLVAVDPRFIKATIPARSYGSTPESAAHTIAVRAVLIGDHALDADLVRDVTRTLFEQRVALAKVHPAAARLRERFDPWDFKYPPHDGAVAYYTRDEPSFFVKYAEAIALGLTVLVGLWSAMVTLQRHYRRSRKERIDVYYRRVGDVMVSSEDPTDEALHAARCRLHDLRREAFEDLRDERLEADESFTIFQDYLLAELSDVDARLAK